MLDDRRYTEIIVTRATVSVGEDIGFLPGTEEKDGALDGRAGRQPGVPRQTDTAPANGAGAATNELIPQPHQDPSMNFMRGRTMNKYVIIDEAQTQRPSR